MHPCSSPNFLRARGERCQTTGTGPFRSASFPPAQGSRNTTSPSRTPSGRSQPGRSPLSRSPPSRSPPRLLPYLYLPILDPSPTQPRLRPSIPRPRSRSLAGVFSLFRSQIGRNMPLAVSNSGPIHTPCPHQSPFPATDLPLNPFCPSPGPGTIPGTIPRTRSTKGICPIKPKTSSRRRLPPCP